MKRKYLIVLLVIVLGFLLWDLFIKPYDYLVTFKVKTYPGVINQAVKTWSNKLENSETISSDDIYHVKQQIKSSDTIFNYNWKISPTSDSTSVVKVYVTNVNNSFINKLQIPFSETIFERDTKRRLLDFNKDLKLHLSNFKVKVIGKAKLKSSYVMYTPIKTTQLKKAFGMMEAYPFLDNLIVTKSIKTTGRPFIEITHWNEKNDSIYYNFCYPIVKTDSLPKSSVIKYKQFNGGDMFKAVYNGNYITSDRAWYKLLDYAESNKIEVVKKPIEVFFSNPNFGGDELEWKAEIFLPLKK